MYAHTFVSATARAEEFSPKRRAGTAVGAAYWRCPPPPRRGAAGPLLQVSVGAAAYVGSVGGQLSRSRMSTGNSIARGSRSGSWSRFTNVSIAVLPRSTIGWRTVVSGGVLYRLASMPSKPVTTQSPGTLIPAAVSAVSAPSAVWAWAATMAPGWVWARNSVVIARPEDSLNSAETIWVSWPEVASRNPARRALASGEVLGPSR